MRATRVPSGILLAAAALAATLLTPGLGQAQQLPRSVTIGSNPPGTGFYAVASGISKVLSGVVPFQIAVQPYSGSSTFLPLLNTGELEFGINNAVDMALAYRGSSLKIGGRNPFPHTPDVRMAIRGHALTVGLLVRKDSPIKTIHEIKGKRTTGEYPAHLAVWYNMFGYLASAGLTWDDVKVVPVPAVNEGLDALVQGRADVSIHALNTAKVKEADATVGVRHISGDCSREAEERLRRAVPGYYFKSLKAGSATALVEDTCVIAYDIYLTVSKKVTDAVVGTLLKGVWDNFEKLHPIHPHLKEWTRERAVTADVTIPYHPGAIRFYRERGVWTPEMEQAQQKLLSLNP
jgi:TRAP transporter TAXI family solute receptor